MTRREFITLLGGAAVAWPLAARAQQRVIPLIGYLSSISPEPEIVATFLRGLGEIGFIDGQNVRIEYRFAEGQYARLSALATDLVRRQVAAIEAVIPQHSPHFPSALVTDPAMETWYHSSIA